MHLRTIINHSIGLMLFLLLLVTVSAFYKTQKSINDLQIVVKQHVPALKLIIQSQNQLSQTNLVYEKFALDVPISNTGMQAYIERLRSQVHKLSQSECSGLLDPVATDQLLRHLGVLLVETNASRLKSGPASATGEQQPWPPALQNTFLKLRAVVHRLYGELPALPNSEPVQMVKNFSNLLNITEDIAHAYLEQEKIQLEKIMAHLNTCVENSSLLLDMAHEPAAIFLANQKGFITQLVASLRRYRSAVVLFSDEKDLGVSGANLDEILSHVRKAQDEADMRLRRLNATIISSMNATQANIISSNLQLQKLSVAVSVFSIVLITATLFMLRHILSKGFRRLINGTERFASGDLNYRLETKPDGEDFNLLANTFNQMAEALQQREIENSRHLEKLNKAQKMEAIGLMAGGVAHDLNNILSGLVSYPDLLLMRLPADSDLRPDIEVIRQSGLRAADMVADLLTFARGAASAKTSASLHALILEYLESPEHKKLLELYPQMTLNVQLDNESKNITCSGTHVKKAVMNLLYNAFETGSEKGKCILSTTHLLLDAETAISLRLESGEYITVTVQDNGPGISDQDIQHIFEPFYTKKKMGRSGTGLGLAIVSNTMLDHGGTVTVKSNAQGSTFTLYFPVDFNQPPPAEDAFSNESVSGNGESILVVDDEVQLQTVACQILSRLNYDVHVVGSGEEAIQFIRKKPVDLVLLDMLMEPGINGCQTYKQIIRIHPGQKAIITSGFAETEAVREALQLGVGCLVHKPYTFKELGAAVKEELSR